MGSNNQLKLLPKGIQPFNKMRNGNYLYVDKTKNIYQLIQKGNYYFLSRPRRFGKSLLISTLAELFSGHKELFNDLWIASRAYMGQASGYSIKFFSNDALSAQALRDDIVWTLQEIGKHYNIDISNAPSMQTTFTSLVKQLGALIKL